MKSLYKITSILIAAAFLLSSCSDDNDKVVDVDSIFRTPELSKSYFPESKSSRYLKVVLPDTNVSGMGMLAEVTVYSMN